MSNHPSSRELYDALIRPPSREWLLGDAPDDAAEVYDHVAACLECWVRLAPLVRASDPQPPSSNTVQRIIEASTVVPGVVGLATLTEGQEPKSGELWRIGHDEALLAWVRTNFRDGAIDVIPVVLDVELADEQTIIVSGTKSPLPVGLGVMVALRTHVHRDAFIDQVANLDISADVEDVIAATREGRDSVVAVGPSVEQDDDDRIGYRQALRDLLAELSPSAWSADSDPVGTDPAPGLPGAVQSPNAGERPAVLFSHDREVGLAAVHQRSNCGRCEQGHCRRRAVAEAWVSIFNRPPTNRLFCRAHLAEVLGVFRGGNPPWMELQRVIWLDRAPEPETGQRLA